MSTNQSSFSTSSCHADTACLVPYIAVSLRFPHPQARQHACLSWLGHRRASTWIIAVLLSSPAGEPGSRRSRNRPANFVVRSCSTSTNVVAAYVDWSKNFGHQPRPTSFVFSAWSEWFIGSVGSEGLVRHCEKNRSTLGHHAPVRSKVVLCAEARVTPEKNLR